MSNAQFSKKNREMKLIGNVGGHKNKILMPCWSYVRVMFTIHFWITRQSHLAHIFISFLCKFSSSALFLLTLPLSVAAFLLLANSFCVFSKFYETCRNKTNQHTTLCSASVSHTVMLSIFSFEKNTIIHNYIHTRHTHISSQSQLFKLIDRFSCQNIL